MSFCPSCNTLMNHVEEENKLYLNCRTCGFREENKNAVIAKKIYKFDDSQAIGNKEHMVYDNTLARTTKKSCINGECPSKTKPDEPNDIVLITDSKSLKLHYICSTCHTEWSA